jgi:peptidoglycan hydrolase-like protein with peptidoglycan-binding domain
MSGHDVRVLQDFLTRAGFPTTVDGQFGPGTEGTVKAFERAHQMQVDGVASLEFDRKLREVLASGARTVPPRSTWRRRASTADRGSQHLGQRALREGMSGHDVRVLQDYLTRVGYPTTIDGQFGPGTAQNVRDFERDHDFQADGVVSSALAAALRKAVASGDPPSSSTSTPPTVTARGTLNSDGTANPPAGAPAAIVSLFDAANRIANDPYCYGGGHASFNSSCYDCSGSVSYALHGAGLLPSPLDSTELESYGGPGPGRWITLWSNSGHVYLLVAGLRFDTAAQSSTGGSRWTSAPRSSAGYVERHPTGW